MQIECSLVQAGTVTSWLQIRTDVNNKQIGSFNASKGFVNNRDKQRFVFASKSILYLPMQEAFTIGKQIPERELLNAHKS
jgi:hypothetical protein